MRIVPYVSALYFISFLDRANVADSIAINILSAAFFIGGGLPLATG
jgi:hypothetical protein